MTREEWDSLQVGDVIRSTYDGSLDSPEALRTLMSEYEYQGKAPYHARGWMFHTRTWSCDYERYEIVNAVATVVKLPDGDRFSLIGE